MAHVSIIITLTHPVRDNINFNSNTHDSSTNDTDPNTHGTSTDDKDWSQSSSNRR